MNAARSVVWNRKAYTLTPHAGGWRLRSRARGARIDLVFPSCSITAAKRQALAHFEGETKVLAKGDKATLEEVIAIYKQMPKKAGSKAAYINECRLRAVVRLARGRELSQVIVSEVTPQLWLDFMAKKLGGRIDLATRRPGNAAINSAVRCAASIFIERLRPGYRSLGVIVPQDATNIQWLQTMKLPKPKALASFVSPPIDHGSKAMRRTVGLARFAGMRQQEISACGRSWIVEDKTGVYVEMRDRPEEGWTSKTGEIYRSLIVNDSFAAELLALPEGPIIETPSGMSREHWFKHYPQEWLKPFTGTAKKPLHRLRGLYADDVKRITEQAVAAHLAGVKAASEALGHTGTAVTQASYLSQ